MNLTVVDLDAEDHVFPLLATLLREKRTVHLYDNYTNHGCKAACPPRSKKSNHPSEYQVGQAFQPDFARVTVRLESLAYSSFDILAGGCKREGGVLVVRILDYDSVFVF